LSGEEEKAEDERLSPCKIRENEIDYYLTSTRYRVRVAVCVKNEIEMKQVRLWPTTVLTSTTPTKCYNAVALDTVQAAATSIGVGSNTNKTNEVAMIAIPNTMLNVVTLSSGS
jgi:hypothetical protein